MKLIMLFNAGRKWLDFSMKIEIDLGFVWVVDINLISVRGTELDFDFSVSFKLVWLLYGWLKLT